MSEEGMISAFEVSEGEERPMREVAVERKRYLHITIVDHNPIVEGTDEESYINLRIPLSLAEAGLKMVPEAKWGNINPDLIVQMVEEGIEGELINITEEKKSIVVRVE